MTPTPNEAQRLAERLTMELLDRGLVIEAGFAGLRIAAYQETPPDDLEPLREAFFAGALHLFSSIMSGLDDGGEETPADLRRMANIHNELQKFEQAFKIRHGMT